MRVREAGDRRSSRSPSAVLLAVVALALPVSIQASPAGAAAREATVPGTGDPAASPREVIFVIDVSDAMRGAALEQARAALTAALARLRPVDTFNVLALGERTRALFPASWPVRPESLGRAARWIAGLEADGGAEVLKGLASALGPPDEGYATPGARPVREVVVFAPGAIGPTAIEPVPAGEAPAAAPPVPRTPSGGQAGATRTIAGATASHLVRLGAGLALFAAALAYALRRGLTAPEAAR